MKKILLSIFTITLLCACGASDSNDDAKLYKEVEKLESKMHDLNSFKMNKTINDKKVNGSCNSTYENSSSLPITYEVIKDDKDFAYKATQKMSDENQFNYLYYKNGTVYEQHSQLLSDITSKPASNVQQHFMFDNAIRLVDTRYYDLSKKSKDKKKIYTIKLVDAKGYNKAFPDDLDDKTCNVTGKYQKQKVTIIVNKDGYLEKITVSETLEYTYNKKKQTVNNTRVYDFYDFNVDNQIDFSFII